jgi:hypothetical protein
VIALRFGFVDDDDVIARTNRAAKEWLDRAQQYLDADKKPDAKKMIANGQKELRAIKAGVVAEEREVRAQFSAARLKTGQAGQTVGLFMNSKHRGQMARARAAGKRSIAQQQQDAMDEYRRVKAAIDNGILQLDRIKLDIDLGKFGEGSETAIVERQRTLETPPASPARWAADPTGRHELRYWDGVQWTEHVSTAGSQSTDGLR